jgi:C4-dicarboxylate-specific signal transduction histidine kinase
LRTWWRTTSRIPLALVTSYADILMDEQIWVRDNGAGLSPEAQARFFTPFTRLDQVRAQGHGLGLSIVRRIVEKLGGQVGVEARWVRAAHFTSHCPPRRRWNSAGLCCRAGGL